MYSVVVLHRMFNNYFLLTKATVYNKQPEQNYFQQFLLDGRNVAALPDNMCTRSSVSCALLPKIPLSRNYECAFHQHVAEGV